MDSKALFTGLLTGSIIGSALALLYSPTTGKETRKALKKLQWPSRSTTTLEQDANSDEWKEVVLEGKEAVDDLADEMKKTYSRYKEEVEPEVQEIQQQIKDISDTISTLNEQVRKGKWDNNI